LLREVLGGQDGCNWEGHKSGAVHVQQVVEFAALPFWGGCVVGAIAVFAHYFFLSGMGVALFVGFSAVGDVKTLEVGR
jgi:uncharacterized membrane protein YdcZ (DUF606 family)